MNITPDTHMSTETMQDLRTLGNLIDDTIEQTEAYLTFNDIDETGIEHSYFGYPAADKRIDYTLTLTSQGLTFTGEDRDRDTHGFTLY